MQDYIQLRYGPHRYTEANLKTVTGFRYENDFVNMSFRGGDCEIDFPVTVKLSVLPETLCDTPADLYALVNQTLGTLVTDWHVNVDHNTEKKK
jgi:hypothetical protein